MPFRWKNLLLWFLIYYLIGDPLQDFIMGMKDNSDSDTIPLFNSILWTVTNGMIFFLFSLFSYLAMFLFFTKKKWHLLIIGLILSCVVTIFIRYGVQQVLTDILFGLKNYGCKHTWMTYFRDNMSYGIRFAGFGVIVYFVQNAFYNQRKAKELTLENKNMQLSMLRSQINPHFLLNSLNNIYSLVYHKSENALTALDTLNDMLKYTLYENKDFVTVEEELTYIHKYVEMQSMRYDYEIEFDEYVDQRLLQNKIPQFIILPIIENAFKHGDLRNGNPMQLRIEKKNDQCIIFCKNKIGNHHKDETGGVGIQNMMKRLELLNKEAYKLNIENDKENYTITISMPLI